MSNTTLVVYPPAKRLLGEAIVSALCSAAIHAMAFEVLTQPPLHIATPANAVVLLIAPDNQKEAIGAIRAWRQRYDNHLVIIVTNETASADPGLIDAGAQACISLSESVEQLVTVIGALHSNANPAEVPTPEALLEQLSHAASYEPALRGSGKLTTREKEVLLLITGGLSNKQIGQQLSISIGTVKNHVHSILNKLQLSRRRETLLWAAPRIEAQTEGMPGEPRRAALA